MWTHRIIAAAIIAVLGTVSLSSPAVAETNPNKDQLQQREMIERLRDLAIAQGDATRLRELALLESELERLERELTPAPATPKRRTTTPNTTRRTPATPGRRANAPTTTRRAPAISPAGPRRVGSGSSVRSVRPATPATPSPNRTNATNATSGLPTTAVGARRAVTVRPSTPAAEGRGLSVTMIGRRTPPKPRPAPGVLAGGGYSASPAGTAPATQVTEVDSDKLYEELRDSIRRNNR